MKQLLQFNFILFGKSCPAGKRKTYKIYKDYKAFKGLEFQS